MKSILICSQALLLGLAVNFAVLSGSHRSSAVTKKVKRVDCTSCTGISKKCINNVCETGIKVYTSSVKTGTNPTRWTCTYHYEWSDNSVSQDYTEINNFACPL
ncbi:hypothetical protein DVR12_22845 [Chitinophaga silvatica]|uniref:Uncharacterized protein n=1 Tax=Chitinophaga silvatica TaxID=2282649 RepID=A0A3E1Y466_9BACT|nr:hypothetical protein [Chitinophaga silvatica]RFS19475.1 hypothetical protein DVR12_22845 [Chitinophaga silvatica]